MGRRLLEELHFLALSKFYNPHGLPYRGTHRY